MRKTILTFLLLAACAPQGPVNNPAIAPYLETDSQMSCTDIALEISDMNKILETQNSGETDPLVRQIGKQTAVTAGQTAATSAGAGMAGPFIGIFVNAIDGMMQKKDNAPDEIAERARLRRAVLYDAFDSKPCE